MKTAGRLAVRIVPDTSKFNEELRAELNRAQRSVDATIQVSAEITDASLKKVQDRLNRVNATVSADVSTASLKNIQRKIGQIDANVTVNADAPLSSLKAAERKISQIKGMATVDVEAPMSALKSVERKLNNLKGKATVHADLDGALFTSARLAFLTRPRIAPILAKVDGAAYAAAESALTALAALSGARVLGDVASNLSNTLRSLDRTAYSLMKTAPAITATIAGLLASTSNLTSSIGAVGSALVSVAPAALVLPGVFAGAATSAVVLAAAAKRASEYLGDFGEEFKAIFEMVGDQVWEQAVDSVSATLESLMPIIEGGLTDVAIGVGNVIASISDAIGSARGLRDIDATFLAISTALEPLADAAYHFTDALISITRVGAELLPEMAEWLARVGENFAIWAANAAESGRMTAWIREAVATTQQLFRLVIQLAGVFTGLGRAVVAASPVETLNDVVDSVERLNHAVNSAGFQEPIAALFLGAREAASQLVAPMAALARTLGGLVPTLNAIMSISSGAIAAVITALSQLLSSPALKAGAVQLFAGLASAIRQLAPVLASLGRVIGPVLGLLGQLAHTIGMVLSTVISTLGPIVARLATQLQPVVATLGRALVSSILTAVNLLRSTIIPALRGIFVNDLLPLFQVVRKQVARMFRALRANAPQLGSALSDIISGLSAFAQQALPRVVDLVVLLIDKFADLASIIASVFTGNSALSAGLGTFVATLRSVFVNDLLPLFRSVLQQVSRIFGALVANAPQLAAALSGIVSGLSALAQRALPIFGSLVVFLIDTFTRLAGVIASVFNGNSALVGVLVSFGTALRSIFANALLPLLQVVLQQVSRIFGALGANAPQLGTALAGIITGLSALAQQVLPAVVDLVVFLIDKFSALAGVIASALTSPALTSGVASFIAGLRGVFTNDLLPLFEAVLQQVSRIFGALVDNAPQLGTALSAIIGGLSSLAQQVLPVVGDLVMFLIDAFTVLAGAIASIFTGDSGLSAGLDAFIAGLRVVFVDELLPLFQVVFEQVTRIFDAIADNAPQLGTALGDLISGLSSLAQEYLPAVVDFVVLLIDKFSALAGVIASAFADNPALIGGTAAFIAALPTIISSIRSVVGFVSALTPQMVIIAGIVAAVVALLPYLVQVVQTLMPYIQEALAAIAPALQALWDALQPVIALVGNALVALAPALGELVAGVGKAIGGVIDILAGFIEYFTAFFTLDFEKGAEAIKKIWQGLWDFIVGIFKGITGMLDKLDNAVTGGRLGNFLAGDGWATDAALGKTTGARADLSNTGASRTANDFAASTPAQTNITINNPVAEPSSTTIRRNADLLNITGA